MIIIYKLVILVVKERYNIMLISLQMQRPDWPHLGGPEVLINENQYYFIKYISDVNRAACTRTHTNLWALNCPRRVIDR